MPVEIIPVKVPGLWPITREVGSIRVAGRLIRDLILERIPEIPEGRTLSIRSDFLPAPLIFKLVPVICLATASLYGCFFNYMSGLTKSGAITGYLAGRIIRIMLFAVLFLIYAFSTKEQLYGFAVELMLAFLAYNLFDTVYFVRFEDKSSK